VIFFRSLSLNSSAKFSRSQRLKTIDYSDYKARFNDNQNIEKSNPKLLNSIILCEIDTAENIRNLKETKDKKLLDSKS
jgi:hypothetical protein